MRIYAFVIIILVFVIGIAGCSSRHSEEQLNAGKYKAWVEEALNGSWTEHSAAIVVIKEDYTLELYESGRLVKQFPAEFGSDPINDKKMAGDDCTPEGIYKVIGKNPQSRFHKAFLLNYPNEEDRREFRELINKGEIPASASIGGDIEIHGCGTGKRRNWTLGCVALTNTAMDEIYGRISVGTPVVIVRYKDKTNRQGFFTWFQKIREGLKKKQEKNKKG